MSSQVISLAGGAPTAVPKPQPENSTVSMPRHRRSTSSACGHDSWVSIGLTGSFFTQPSHSRCSSPATSRPASLGHTAAAPLQHLTQKLSHNGPDSPPCRSPSLFHNHCNKNSNPESLQSAQELPQQKQQLQRAPADQVAAHPQPLLSPQPLRPHQAPTHTNISQQLQQQPCPNRPQCPSLPPWANQRAASETHMAPPRPQLLLPPLHTRSCSTITATKRDVPASPPSPTSFIDACADMSPDGRTSRRVNSDADAATAVHGCVNSTVAPAQAAQQAEKDTAKKADTRKEEVGKQGADSKQGTDSKQVTDSNQELQKARETRLGVMRYYEAWRAARAKAAVSRQPSEPLRIIVGFDVPAARAASALVH